MPSTFFGLNIGKTGLYAYQAALNTTAHNISNAETEGYSRQVMGQQAAKALKMNNTYGMAGTGVNVTGVTQLRNEYYDVKFWKNSTVYGDYFTKMHYMTKVENYFNEIELEGFTKSFNSMFDSLQELSKNPSSLTVRTQLTNFGKSLTEYFNHLSTGLKGIQEECNFEIKNKVDQINSIAQQVAAATKQINTLEVGGVRANDLRDQRALLIDELSEIANVSVTEKIVGDGIGVTSYVVRLNGQTLVDGYNFNTLKVVPREQKINQCDIDGLYSIEWSNGQAFDTTSPSLGGTLKALFEVRDGNNLNNFRGSATGTAASQFVTITDSNIQSIEKLNIPQEGVITIGDREYVYQGFEATKNPLTGKFEYTFELEKPLAVSVSNTQASIGTSINYKGIPYYMAQMNEFIRTFAKEFNEVHKRGQDLQGNSGGDFFSATHKVTGQDYVFGPQIDTAAYNDYLNTFNSQTGSYKNGANPFGSYYFMTAESFTISQDVFYNPSRIATTSDINKGVEGNDIIKELINLKTKKDMFKQGDPAGFLQTLVAEIGIDTSKATNFAISQDNILRTITFQKLSVSGVDTDEEAMNLVRFQNAYNLSAKVISVMDEIYDRLINYMGV